MDGDRHGAVPVRVAHLTHGRARLRLDAPLSRQALGSLVDRLARESGATRVAGRPNTGSIILEADEPAEAIAAMLGTCDAIRVVEAGPPPPVGQVAQLGLMQIDAGIRSRTEGALDFRTVLAVLLVIGAAIQLGRGRVAGPATTLLLSALSLIEQRK